MSDGRCRGGHRSGSRGHRCWVRDGRRGRWAVAARVVADAGERASGAEDHVAVVSEVRAHVARSLVDLFVHVEAHRVQKREHVVRRVRFVGVRGDDVVVARHHCFL